MQVSERLDRLPLGRFHYKLLLLSGLGWFFDSMDTGLVSFILPHLKDEWSLRPTQIGWTGTGALLGMLVGGALAGILSDRYGRKRIFQVTLLIFSIATGLCAFAWSFTSLLLLRVVVGLGLGGELPVAASLVSEFSPARHRGRLVVLLESFWALGWTVALLIGYFLVSWSESRGSPFPWRFAFLIGALPAFYVLILRRSLPESPRFLVSRGRIDEAEATLRVVERDIGVTTAPGDRLEPDPDRGRLVVLLESFWALGWTVALLIGYFRVSWSESRGSTFPWRFAFLIGALPAFYVLILRRSLPESPRFLVSRGRIDEAESTLRAVESGIGVTTAPGDRLEPDPDSGRPARVRDLFGPEFLRRTAILWILWFTMAYSFYGIFIWLPTLLYEQGLPMAKSIRFSLFITLAQLPGYFAAAYLVEKIGRKATLAPFMLLCAVASYFFGLAHTPSELIAWGCMVSFFNLGAWGVTYGYTPELYPTRLRGTGAGSAAAFGRLGAILAPLIVGMILESWGGGFPLIFTMFAGVLVVGAAGVMLLGEETRGRTLERISG